MGSSSGGGSSDARAMMRAMMEQQQKASDPLYGLSPEPANVTWAEDYNDADRFDPGAAPQVIGRTADGQVLTDKSHPHLIHKVRRRLNTWGGGGEMGGNPDGGRADGSGEE